MDDPQRAREPALSCLRATLQDMRNRGWISDIIESLILRAGEADATTLRAAPEGFVLVPVYPTEEMVTACEKQWSVGSTADMAGREWAAMLTARPRADDAT